jgi:spermidine/putrescine transport system ATP-binding protein
MRIKKLPNNEIKNRVKEMLSIVDLKGYEKRSVSKLSGGQQQRVAIARALVCDPKVLLLDEPLGALDLKLRKNMQWELKQIQQKTNTAFVYVTHDQEEALTMSDTVVVMNNGVIEQIGTPADVYNEPVNAFVADFIGDANILNGTMIDDCRVRILGEELECVDKGFGQNTPVDIVIRPEDIEVVKPEEAKLTGKVTEVVFKGVHYEMTVMCKGCEWIIHSTKCEPVGTTIGMKVIPFNIQIMNKMFSAEKNTFYAEVISSDKEANSITVKVEDCEFEIENQYFEAGTRLEISLPPSALSIAGDGVGHIDDVYIESVIFKGEHNEIILESDEQKWLMQSDVDEQVATYVPLKFDFTKAEIKIAEGKNET